MQPRSCVHMQKKIDVNMSRSSMWTEQTSATHRIFTDVLSLRLEFYLNLVMIIMRLGLICCCCFSVSLFVFIIHIFIMLYYNCYWKMALNCSLRWRITITWWRITTALFGVIEWLLLMLLCGWEHTRMIVQLTGFNSCGRTTVSPFWMGCSWESFFFFTVLIPAIYFFDASRWPSE